jgi:predicted PhzF superfamily epimerase YddE/YHI9
MEEALDNRSVPVFLVDSFTDRALGGNPAAVCLLDGPVEEAWMQRIAGELNQAATAFVIAAAKGDVPLRWFTSTTELTLCGHGTLAAAHVLWETGRADRAGVAFDTIGGRLTAGREDGRIGLGFPAIGPRPVEPPEGLRDVLGDSVSRWVGRNELDLLVELATEAEVRSLRPDLERLRGLDARGLIVTAASNDPSASFVSRYFAPRIGIPEDHATGSAHCALGPFWGERLGLTRMVGIQLSARGGVIEVRLDLVPGGVYLVGNAVTVLRGTLSLGNGTPSA